MLSCVLQVLQPISHEINQYVRIGPMITYMRIGPMIPYMRIGPMITYNEIERHDCILYLVNNSKKNG